MTQQPDPHIKLVAIIPIKRNSERLHRKNFLTLAEKPLYRWVMDTLLSVDAITKVLIDTDCPELLNDLPNDARISIRLRPKNVSGDAVTMNTLLSSILPDMEEEHFLQTHVTNPLLKESTIIRCIERYLDRLEENDSLLTVDRVQKRVYSHDGSPINHHLEIMLQTQDLKPVFVENSNLFLFSKSSFYGNNESRVGKTPQLFEMTFPESLDIDTHEDFSLAQMFLNR